MAASADHANGNAAGPDGSEPELDDTADSTAPIAATGCAEATATGSTFADNASAGSGGATAALATSTMGAGSVTTIGIGLRTFTAAVGTKLGAVIATAAGDGAAAGLDWAAPEGIRNDPAAPLATLAAREDIAADLEAGSCVERVDRDRSPASESEETEPAES